MNSNKLIKWLGPFIWFSIVLLVGVFLAGNHTHLKIETNILKLLPRSESNPLLEIAFESYASKNMQQLVFLVESNELNDAVAVAKDLTVELQQSEHIDSIKTQVDAKMQKNIGEFLFQYRHLLLSNSDRQKLANNLFDDFAADSLELLYSPLSGGLANLILKDPFLLSYRFSQSLNTQSNLILYDGFLTAEAGQQHYVFVVASLAKSPFDQLTQKNFEKQLNDIEQYWLNQKIEVRLLKTGAMFYASEAYKAAEQEISTIGLTSLILVVLLVIISFRSLTPLILTSLALFSGIASGLVVILLLFAEIHLITLVFGASLIGVAVDYAFHYFVVPKSAQGIARVAIILPAISLGLLSSIVGYLSLLTTPFPGLNQIALFCIVGLTVAFVTVILLFPRFQLKADASHTLLRLCRHVLDFTSNIPCLKVWRVLWILPVIAILVVTFQTVSQDNIRQFQTTNKKLIQDEVKIKSILELEASNQFFLVFSDSEESLLREMEAIQPVLQDYVDKGIIEGFENLSQRLPSQNQQRRNYRLITDLYQASAKGQLIELGIMSEPQFMQAQTTMSSHSELHLMPDEWLDSDLGKTLNSLWLGKVDQVFAAIVPIRGINDLAALSNINDHALFVDKVNKVTEIFSEYRVQTSKLLVAALLLITIMLTVRYGLFKSIMIVSAPLFSISITILMLFILNVHLTLFNTLALFLIIGIGIDYGLFFAESKKLSERTFLAIFLSALTTIFSFGLLALSQTIAIQAFGLTMFIGIASSFILSPIVGSLVLKKQEIRNGSH